ncbi:hypothetical protein P3W45_000579 [Vairimorpha bombi]|jgi:tRNA-dihydrouridine synthase 1
MKFLEKLTKPYKILAPMVGNSELAWRSLARRYGADICCTEMINCESFLRTKKNPISNQWYTTNSSDRPLIIQICGNDVSKMLETSLIVQKYCDAIDINFGCPQEIARRGNYGSFLQDDWIKITEIVSVLSSKLSVPVTCKIRIFESIEKSIEYARMIENAGCKMLTVHGRTREQRGVNTGLASWKHIREIKSALSIPVISNGNIIYTSDIQECLDFTRCDGVMVAETHLYNPLIFSDIKKTSVEVYREYLDIFEELYNDYDVSSIKSHSFKLLHTFLRSHTTYREKLNICKKLEDFKDICVNIEKLIRMGEIDDECLEMHPYIR